MAINREQVGLLLAKASAAFPSKAPNLKNNPQIFELWVERLAFIDPNLALQNLNDHIDDSNFFPDIADIIRERYVEKVDPEIYHRNKQIANQQWVTAGGDPEAFVYEPGGNGTRLTGGAGSSRRDLP
jgi:hypothetical protein